MCLGFLPAWRARSGDDDDRRRLTRRQPASTTRRMAMRIGLGSSQADNASSRGRFVLEAEVTGGLEHPGIVPVYGLGHDPTGRPYYAMRFIRGDNLGHAI